MLKLKNILNENKKLLIWFFINTLIYLSVFIAYDIDKFPLIYGFIINLFIFLIYIGYKYFNHKDTSFKDILKNPNPRHNEKVIIDEYFLLDKKYKDLLIDYNQMEESIRDFYGLWIHEIKTPIAENRLILAEENPDINLLIKNNKRIDSYLDILLGFVRFNSKTNDYIFKEISIEPLVKNIIREKSYEFISKNITIELKDLSYKTVSDGKWLSFIISQIINNSLKYTNEGGKIKIYFDHKLLVIYDDGIGIKAIDLARVFEMGYTGTNGRKVGSTTGLGLYLVKSIGKDLNLDIKIESKEGKFTKIIINFPKLTKL